MSTNLEFAALMADKGDNELLDVLARPDDYVPEAFEAAMAELCKRKLSVDQAAVLQSIKERRRTQLQELCPHCLRPESFEMSSVCTRCGKDRTVVRFLCEHCSQTLEAPRNLS